MVCGAHKTEDFREARHSPEFPERCLIYHCFTAEERKNPAKPDCEGIQALQLDLTLQLGQKLRGGRGGGADMGQPPAQGWGHGTGSQHRTLCAVRVPSPLSPLLPPTPRILDNNRIAWITPATFSGLRSLYFL